MIIHPSHKTRTSDASTYDEICVNCGANDGFSKDKLAERCPSPKARKYRIAPRTQMWRSRSLKWKELVQELWEPFVSDKWVTYDETDMTDGAEPATYYYFKLPCFNDDDGAMYTGIAETGPAFPWTRLRVMKYQVGGPYDL